MGTELEQTQQESETWRKNVQRQDRELRALQERQQKFDSLASEVSTLKKRLRKATGGHLSTEDLAQKVAEHECAPLERMKAEMQAAFKKKLLVIWMRCCTWRQCM